MYVIMDSITGASGRGMPEGGIIPARSLRTTFSPISAWSLQLGEVELIERQPTRFQALIVAGDAVLVEKGALRRARSREHRRNRRKLLCAGGLNTNLHGDDHQQRRKALTFIQLASQGLALRETSACSTDL